MLTRLFAHDRAPDPDSDAILGQHPVHVIFKHSPLCVVSALARDEVERFSREAPSLPITVVDVIRQRALSDGIAARTRVRHASPQVLLVQEGQIRWHTSHGGITAEALSRAVVGLSGEVAEGRDAS
jgi:bacillithiol system protein YtxJ